MNSTDMQYEIHQREHEQRLQRAAMRRMMTPESKQSQGDLLRRLSRLITILFV